MIIIAASWATQRAESFDVSLLVDTLWWQIQRQPSCTKSNQTMSSLCDRKVRFRQIVGISGCSKVWQLRFSIRTLQIQLIPFGCCWCLQQLAKKIQEAKHSCFFPRNVVFQDTGCIEAMVVAFGLRKLKVSRWQVEKVLGYYLQTS